MEPSRSASQDAAATAELAALLKTFRVEAGLSQQALAERALISVQAVSALERGYRKAPYRATLERIADALTLSEEARQTLERCARPSRGPRLAAPKHNLPRQLTSFLGRDEVVQEIAELVDTAPLVSIVGTGGAGKTRAAVEVGTRSLSRFRHGVWFVELAPLNDPALVPHALAAALRVQESPPRSLLETLFAYLAQKRLLIILDNCEHVLSQARALAGSLLRECPGVALLTTSRGALNVAGERSYQIPSLSVPKQNALSPHEAVTYGAVALFIDRVRAADSRFEITAENVPPVVEICRRLDGLPLALELAAARASVLSPQEICDRLDRVFDTLTEGRQALVPRHATMRAVIDWSYELLSSQAQLLFDRLAIFAGGFTLETATTVCADESIPRQSVLESLSSLIAQSLVVVDFAHGGTRYHLLEATRQYAAEKLAERGERPALARRHALALLQIAVRLDRDWYGAAERSWFREAEAELDNFRAALGWSLGERGDLRSGCLLAGALARLWYSLSSVEGRRWVRLAIDSITEETRADELAQLYIADAELCGALFESAASLQSAEQALRLRSVLDDLQVARAEHAAGSALAAIGEGSRGEALLQDTLAAAERLENRRLQALALSDLGTARSRDGDVDGARRFYGEALSLYVSLGLERPAASIAGHLAEVECEAGDLAAALHRAEEARAGHAATRNRRSEAADLSNMTAYLVALDCFDDARVYAAQALEAAREIRSPVLTAFVLQHVAAIAALQSGSEEAFQEKKLERAAMLLGFVEERLKSLGARRDYTERQECERITAALRNAFGERLDDLMALGEHWSEEGAAVALEL
ncbi:MAG TPA: helix-turn-helix domain-containing protein [Candidatus Cybelea sp.]|nr:helix-turn-helix domain-containing protein [Candidatus Cybelea sp.]